MILDILLGLLILSVMGSAAAIVGRLDGLRKDVDNLRSEIRHSFGWSYDAPAGGYLPQIGSHTERIAQDIAALRDRDARAPTQENV